MAHHHPPPFRYPDIPAQFKDDTAPNSRQLLVVGVLGKSHLPSANKMSPIDILQYYPSLDPTGCLPPPHWPNDSDISFYFQPQTDANHGSTDFSAIPAKASDPLIVYMHIVSPADTACLENLAEAVLSDPDQNILTLAASAQNRSARLFLLAVQVCHIVVVAEPSDSFDASYLTLFRALRKVREQFVVPQLAAAMVASVAAEPEAMRRILKPILPSSSLDSAADLRFCSPRFLFHFARSPPSFAGDLKQLEFEVEDRIYKMLRNEFIITNNAAVSLFSIPRNKRFVHINGAPTAADSGGEDAPATAATVDDDIDDDPLLDSLALLQEFIDASGKRDRRSLGEIGGAEFDDIRPYRGYAKPLRLYEDAAAAAGGDGLLLSLPDLNAELAGCKPPPQPSRRRSFASLLAEHCAEALAEGFNDSCSKFRGRAQFFVPTVRQWFAQLPLMYSLLVADPPTEAAQLPQDAVTSFRHQLQAQLQFALSTDLPYLAECGELGYNKAYTVYRKQLPSFYGRAHHERRLQLAADKLRRTVRWPPVELRLLQRLREATESLWHSGGREQCEERSLHGHLCGEPKQHLVMLVASETVSAGDGAQTAGYKGHQSSAVWVAACNCGRVQMQRADPYTVRQANYEFYAQAARMCGNCGTAAKAAEQWPVPVFRPVPGQEYRAAVVEPVVEEGGGEEELELVVRSSQVAVVEASGDELFLEFSEEDRNEVASDLDNPTSASSAAQVPGASFKTPYSGSAASADSADSADSDSDSSDSLGSLNEIVLQQKAPPRSPTLPATPSRTATATALAEPPLRRQISTTEYLPGMLHTRSPPGLLPLFPSWSLLCLGNSCAYSHSTGLTEYVQRGFLPGSNFLLPWNVHIRLEHATVWAAAYERSRPRPSRRSGRRNSRRNPPTGRNNRDKHVATTSNWTPPPAARPPVASGQAITLKVFIGCEYECARGHRFFMSAPDRVMRNGLADCGKDSANRVAFNEMPLWALCPCNGAAPLDAAAEAEAAATISLGVANKFGGVSGSAQRIAQLMRVHIVTPKAPVNVMVAPRVRVGGGGTARPAVVFAMGESAPPKLTPSAYWMLRLPMVYSVDGERPVMMPPHALPVAAAEWTRFGCLEAAMFSVEEAEAGAAAAAAAVAEAAMPQRANSWLD